jgi:hypothetical protein
VETQMSENDWGEIKYSSVPSKAMSIYNKAFSRRDGYRFSTYLEKVSRGEEKINTSSLMAYEVVAGYLSGKSLDNYTETAWADLISQYKNTLKNTIVVCDTSGSMFTRTTPSPASVALSLSLISAEAQVGAFNGKVITFDANPTFIDLSVAKNLNNKVSLLRKADWGYNTDINAVFDLILFTAVQNHVPQEDMPSRIVIISDMQFDECGHLTNYDAIINKYNKAGYVVPTIVFWNVSGAYSSVPQTSSTEGVVMLSGFHQSLFKSVATNKSTTPYDFMVETVMNERYDMVEQYCNKRYEMLEQYFNNTR